MFKKILVPLDGSSLAENVLPHAVALARAYEAHCTLVRVLEAEQTGAQVQPVDPLYWRMNKAEAEAYLEEQATRLRSAGLEVDSVVMEGKSAPRIVELAQTTEANLIVMSSHGQSGLSRWNVSSVVHKTIQHSRISIMITRAYRSVAENLTDLLYKRILLPLDGSQRAECALPPVTTLARSHDAQLLVAHVVAKPTMLRHPPASEEGEALAERVVEYNRQAANHYLDQLESRLAIEFEPHLLVSEDVTASLHELANTQDVDLVVLCAHGYSGRRKWPYGSVATSFIEYGATPLLIIQDLPPEEVELTEAEVAAEEHTGH
jgi:nucleotide-binding universal stress UspA family protein